MISSFLVLSLALGGSGRGQGSEISALRSFTGWGKTAYSVHFTAADLHKYLNGGAAKYLAYNIEELRVQEYQRASDGFVAVAELYVMDSPPNAFGVYSCDRGGEHPAGLGEEASYEGGLLQFWRGRSYVRVYPRDPSDERSKAVLELGMAISDALGSVEAALVRTRATPGREGTDEEGPAGPAGRNCDLLPQVVARMPAAGLIEDSLCFFHTLVSLNSIYYLSEENLLGLSNKTDAVSAEYRTLSGKTARVIAVHYPADTSASKAYEAFCDLYLGRAEPASQSGGTGIETVPTMKEAPKGDMGDWGSGYAAPRAVDSTGAALVGETGQRAPGSAKPAGSPRGQAQGRSSDWPPSAERWSSTEEREWIYAGLHGRYLVLVVEAQGEEDAATLGRTVLASLAGRG